MRGRSAALGVVVGAVSSLTATGVASAGTSAGALGASSVNTPVGVAAVAFGAVGLVAGLVRRRRAAVERAKADGAVAGAQPEAGALSGAAVALSEAAAALPAAQPATRPAPTGV
ncbi:hypothetical protein [Saccharothrix australiensis]|uniref:LPXTG-motif cell wall-anchored protein n=1 Tax=Saccharothrix australiensis TaxID=2072 RepID=A0A495W7E5_9PSEU|nr:hypothetical protein [Saccharothrix australiensis]RKT57606.1 hypothetical protein C8E97_6328 [Saccharothrix australiensis]